MIIRATVWFNIKQSDFYSLYASYEVAALNTSYLNGGTVAGSIGGLLRHLYIFGSTLI
jgi:hypothetical protein